MMETIMTKDIMAKAQAHELLYHHHIQPPGTGEDPLGLDWAAMVGLDALRDDIQDMATALVKEHGPGFWWEVFGDARSACPFATEGQCTIYSANDPEGTQCGYAYLGASDISGNPCPCMKTKLADKAHPTMTLLPPGHRGSPIDGSGSRVPVHDGPQRHSADVQRLKDHKGPCAQCGAAIPPGEAEFGIYDDDDEPQRFCNALCMGAWNVARGLLPWGEVPPQDVETLRRQALCAMMNALGFADTDQNLDLCMKMLGQLEPIIEAYRADKGASQ